jgi:hypothetical protein
MMPLRICPNATPIERKEEKLQWCGFILEEWVGGGMKGEGRRV